MKEGGTHRAFKRVGVDILKEKGFCASEISEEYVLEYVVGENTKYIIDLVGIKDDYKIAIECGSVEYSKLINLRKIFDEVIIVNTNKVIELYDYWRSRCILETDKFRDEIERLNVEIGSLNERIKHILSTETGETMSLKYELSSVKKDMAKLERKLRAYQRVMLESWEAVKEQS